MLAWAAGKLQNHCGMLRKHFARPLNQITDRPSRFSLNYLILKSLNLLLKHNWSELNRAPEPNSGPPPPPASRPLSSPFAFAFLQRSIFSEDHRSATTSYKRQRRYTYNMVPLHSVWRLDHSNSHFSDVRFIPLSASRKALHSLEIARFMIKVHFGHLDSARSRYLLSTCVGASS